MFARHELMQLTLTTIYYNTRRPEYQGWIEVGTPPQKFMVCLVKPMCTGLCETDSRAAAGGLLLA